MVQVATALVELDIDHGVVRQHGHQHVDRRYVRADDDDVKHVAERVLATQRGSCTRLFADRSDEVDGIEVGWHVEMNINVTHKHDR